MPLKRCPKCGVSKDMETGFNKSSRTPDKHQSLCRDCLLAYSREHAEVKVERTRGYRQAFQSLPLDVVSQVLSYDPDTGTIYQRGVPLREGGSKYKTVYTHKCSVRVHRLAWFLTHGIWPENVDHIDGNPSNNKLENLRLCNDMENTCNRSRHRNGGLIGAFIHGRKWASSVTIDGCKTHIGSYDTEREASLEYCKYVLSHGLVRREFLPAEFTDKELGIGGDK